MPDNVIKLQASWVFPVSGPPLRDGIVEITGDQITAVHDRPDPGARKLPGMAIIPGLVNAHTHLEFSSLAEPLAPPTPFTDWLRSVIRWRRSSAVPAGEAVAEGQRQAYAAGTTTLGEIASASWDGRSLDPQGSRVVAFHESLGLRPERREEQLGYAKRFLDDQPSTPHVIRGLSPHAPYSVHPDLFRDLVALAAKRQVPLAMHLAETAAERELLDRGTGEFVTFLEQMGVWDATAIPPGTRPLDYLRELDRLPHALVVHGNFLDDEEQAYLAGRDNLTVVYCPRTHAYFKHPPHPWRKLSDRGIRVALGTDSRASNPDLSLWSEVQFLRQKFPQVSSDLLLRMATLHGAEALGLAGDTGTLEPGKRADLACIQLSPAESSDPYSQLFEADSVPVSV